MQGIYICICSHACVHVGVLLFYTLLCPYRGLTRNHPPSTQVIPPKGWYPEKPKTQEETEALVAKLRLMVPPIRQYVSGARGAYQLALVRCLWGERNSVVLRAAADD